MVIHVSDTSHLEGGVFDENHNRIQVDRRDTYPSHHATITKYYRLERV